MNKQELIRMQAHNTWEALRIGLGMYNINYGVDYTGFEVHNSVMLISYTLNMVNTSKWKVIAGMTTELSQMAQLGRTDRARVSYEGLKYRIEIPKPRQLHDQVEMIDIFDQAKGLNVSFGMSAYDSKPNSVDFSGTQAGHMLVSGSTRCGKTNILKIIAMCLMYKNSPDKMRIAVIDTVKAEGKYSALKNSAHLVTDVIDTDNKAVAFLTWAKNTIMNQKGRQYSHKIIIIIDEVYLLVQNKKIGPLLNYIASAGAEVGFHLIPATQYTKVDDIGGTQFKGNLMTRVVGQVDNHYASSNATGREGLGAENLMAPGDFLVVDKYGTNRIAVPEMKDDFYNKIPRGMVPLAKINWTEEDLGNIPELTGSVRSPNMETCFAKIDPRLLQLAISGRHKNGKYFGADVIRKASLILAKKGLGKSIGNQVANEYVKFAKRYRQAK